MELTFGLVELPEEPPPGRGKPQAFLNLKLSRDGRTVTNWQVGDFRFRDAYGNHLLFSPGAAEGVEWQRYLFWGSSLDPAHVWKGHFSLAQDADFSADELCTFDVRYPLTTQKIEVCHGRKLKVGFPNTNYLSLFLLDTNANVRLTFVKAVDEGGTRLFSGHRGTMGWTQHAFLHRLTEYASATGEMVTNVLKPGTVVKVTVAIHTNYVGEYVFTPRKVAQKTPH